MGSTWEADELHLQEQARLSDEATFQARLQEQRNKLLEEHQRILDSDANIAAARRTAFSSTAGPSYRATPPPSIRPQPPTPTHHPPTPRPPAFRPSTHPHTYIHFFYMINEVLADFM